MKDPKTHMQSLLVGVVEKSEVPRLLERRQKLLERMAVSEVVLKRFWGNSEIGKPDECWNWKGPFFKRGNYGIFSITENGKNFKLRTNRVAFYFSTKTYPGEFFVCHTCDNPKCVNPNRLFLGTHEINQLDKVDKGRTPMGTKHFQHLLTEELVSDMRHRCLVLGQSRASVADFFGFNQNTVVCAVLGRTWKHVPFPKGFEL